MNLDEAEKDFKKEWATALEYCTPEAQGMKEIYHDRIDFPPGWLKLFHIEKSENKTGYNIRLRLWTPIDLRYSPAAPTSFKLFIPSNDDEVYEQIKKLVMSHTPKR